MQLATERVGILYSSTLNAPSNESLQAILVADNISKCYRPFHQFYTSTCTLKYVCTIVFLVVDVQIPTRDELQSTESINFPSMPYSSDDNTFEMIPMIEIPSAAVLNQMESEGC